MFSVIPAIDVTRGRLGVYVPEGPKPIDAFDGDPVEAAGELTRHGAGWLHVVDMDLAFGGAVANAGVVGAIHRALPDVAIQASGGLRTEREVASYLEAGATRVVLGSAALGDEHAFAAVLAAAAGRCVVGVEVDGGRVRSRGRDPVDLDLMTTLGWLTAIGAPGFLVTAVEKVGTKRGPDVATIRRVARSGRPTLAAGGIATVEHLAAVHAAGAVGAVVGRAAHDGSFDLTGALAWATEH